MMQRKLPRKKLLQLLHFSRNPSVSYWERPNPLASLVKRSISIWVRDDTDAPLAGALGTPWPCTNPVLPPFPLAGWVKGPVMALACTRCWTRVYAEDAWCVCWRVAVPTGWTVASRSRARQQSRARSLSIKSHDVPETTDQNRKFLKTKIDKPGIQWGPAHCVILSWNSPQ